MDSCQVVWEPRASSPVFFRWSKHAVKRDFRHRELGSYLLCYLINVLGIQLNVLIAPCSVLRADAERGLIFWEKLNLSSGYM